MRLLFLALTVLPLWSQAPTTWKIVQGSNGETYRVPDFHELLPFGDMPVSSMLRTSQIDFPAPSEFTEKTWTDDSMQAATREIVDIADGGRLAGEVLSGPIDKRAWPHKALSEGWARISGKTRASGQSIFTAQERWLQWYWGWWFNRAKGLAPGVNIEKEDQVRAHFGDDAPLTHWRVDLIQRSRQWAKADQAIRRGLPPPAPVTLVSAMGRTLTDFYQGN